MFPLTRATRFGTGLSHSHVGGSASLELVVLTPYESAPVYE